MFQDYKSHLAKQFPHPVNTACLAQNGTLLLQAPSSITISHLRPCPNPIPLLNYFKHQLKINQPLRCNALANVTLQQSDGKRCCFGLAINQNFWLIVVSIVSQHQEPIQLQLQRVKLINLRQEQNSLDLRLVNTQAKGNIILQQTVKEDLVKKYLNIIRITSYNYLTGTLTYFKSNHLKLAKVNQEENQKWHQLLRANLLYQIFEAEQTDKLLVYHQLVSPRTLRHTIYVYNDTEPSLIQTFAECCLTLPSFDDEKLLAKILPVATEQTHKIQLTYLLLFYQLPNGLEIAQVQFQSPTIVLRKFVYLDINFVRLLTSSITLEEIYLKGLQNCIQNHTVLIQTSKNVAENHYLTLLSLPSTGNPQILNELQVHSDFQYLKHEKDKILLYTEKGIIDVEILSKHKIYEAFIQVFKKKGVSYLNSIGNEILQFLY